MRAARFSPIAIVGRAALLGVLLLVAACTAAGPTNTPFAKYQPGSPTAQAAPPVRIGVVNGMPEDKRKALKQALVVEATQRQIPIVAETDTNAITITGDVRAVPSAETVSIDYRWAVVGKGGSILYTMQGQETVPKAQGDVWASLDPVVTKRIAAISAEDLSARLGQMGFATQVGGIPPPPDAYVKAGPGAEKDIDYAMMNNVPLGPYGEAVKQGRAASDSVNQVASTTPPQEPPADAVPPPEKTASAMEATPGANTTHIRAARVSGVTGSPGKGNAELANAMRRTLADAGWPVVDKAAPDAIDISGEVSLGPMGSETQRVLLNWTVKMPDGTVIGTLKQGNEIKPGSLDAGWGDTAYLATQAASEGIFDLVNKLR
ncbi:MAG: hypothetical protein U1E46_13330 [Hyphomicrobiales bacterium]